MVGNELLITYSRLEVRIALGLGLVTTGDVITMTQTGSTVDNAGGVTGLVFGQDEVKIMND